MFVFTLYSIASMHLYISLLYKLMYNILQHTFTIKVYIAYTRLESNTDHILQPFHFGESRIILRVWLISVSYVHMIPLD